MCINELQNTFIYAEDQLKHNQKMPSFIYFKLHSVALIINIVMVFAIYLVV